MGNIMIFERAVVIEFEPYDKLRERICELLWCIKMGGLLGLSIIFFKLGFL